MDVTAAVAPVEAPRSSPRRGADLEVLLLALAVLVLAALLEVTPDQQGVTLFGWRVPESCGAKRWLDLSCPGCGLTRSFSLGMHGDLAAFRLHPAGPLLLLVVLGQVPYRAARLWRARATARAGLVELTARDAGRGWAALRWGLLGALLLGWALRAGLGLAP